jgi:hypothetical protein
LLASFHWGCASWMARRIAMCDILWVWGVGASVIIDHPWGRGAQVSYLDSFRNELLKHWGRTKTQRNGILGGV